MGGLGTRLCCEAAMSLSDTVSSRNGSVGERDCRWFASAFVLIQIAIAIEATSQVLWISRESIGNILGIWLPGWLMVIFRVSSLCVYSLLLAGVVQITWPLKRHQRSVISWAACWGLFNVFFIWFLFHLAYRVNDLILFASGRDPMISAWLGGALRWLMVGFPVLGLVAGYGVARALNIRFGGALSTRRGLHIFFGTGLIVLLLGHLQPYIYQGLAFLGVFDLLVDALSPAFIHFLTGYRLLLTLPQLIWLGFGIKMLRRARRQITLYPAGTKCPQCGYDIRSDPESGCPECGWRRG